MISPSPAQPPLFDLTIVTARDAAQQWLFERRLAQLRLQEWTRETLVVADPPGPPPGSGGSTIYALCAALDRLRIAPEGGSPSDAAALAERLGRYRILIVHCGGLSQRLPQFASLGKAFAPVGEDADGEPLLSAVVRSLAVLCSGVRSGVVVACGDVLFRGSAPHRFPESEAVAWAWPARLEQASRHGVYRWDENTGRATAALQKPSIDLLRTLGFRDQAPLDTGAAYFSPRVAADLLSAAVGTVGGKARCQALSARERWQGLDLYGELLPALVAEGEDPPRDARACLTALWGHNLHILCPPDGEFLHFGTTAELLRILHGAGSTAPLLIHTAAAAGTVSAGAGSVVQFCRVRAPLEVGSNSYVLGLQTRCGTSVVGDKVLAYQAPLTGAGAASRVLVALGINDDPKRGPDATLMGEELEQWASRRGLSTAELWTSELPACERSLWNARLFPRVTPQRLPVALDWLHGRQAAGKRLEGPPLLSLAEIHLRFDARRWWRYESGLRQLPVAQAIVERLRHDPELSAAEVAPVPVEDPPVLRNELGRLATRESDPLLSARIWRLGALLAGETEPAGVKHARAFAAIRRGVTFRAEPAGQFRWQAAPDDEVTVAAPVRVDLAGGWTDTPPQACEMGGTVLNMALHLEGRLPVRAAARVLAEPVLHLVSRDLGLERRIVHPEELRDCRRPGDPFAIHKAALLECGFGGTNETELARLLQAAGGGLRIETESRVPKGSGLGTSSILGAVVLAALRHLTGRDTGWESLFQAVLTLEQRITTGGGWQDQIGGMLPKIKLTVTEPGLVQVPRVTYINCPTDVEQQLEEHLVLFYTGVPRLARNVLQRVVSRYLAREPEIRPALRRMKALSHHMADALRQGDFASLGSGLRESWELNCLLEPTATHEEIDRILQRIAPYCYGWKLAGAGGGGFMLLLARSTSDARFLSDQLTHWQPEGEVYRTGLARLGLTITPAGCSVPGPLVG